MCVDTCIGCLVEMFIDMCAGRLAILRANAGIRGIAAEGMRRSRLVGYDEGGGGSGDA